VLVVHHHGTKRSRPLARRLSTGTSGPFATATITVIVLYLTLAPIVFTFGPNGAAIGSAMVEFGRQLEPGALAFQGIAVGLLGAILIGRVIAPVPDVRNQTGVDVFAAMAGHFLSAVIIAAAGFTVIGTIHDSKRAGGVWFVIVLAVVSFGFTQAIDARITFGRKRQRQRTRNDLIVMSWGIHRRAALLLTCTDPRRAPARRLTGIVAATIVVDAGVGTGIVATAYPNGGGVMLPIIFASALAVASWSTFWVSFLIASAFSPTPGRFLPAATWAIVLLTTAAPAAVIATVPTAAAAVPLKIAAVFTALAPFGHLLVRVGHTFSLQAALMAVELRRYRRRRLTLVRDYYALRKRRLNAERAKAGSTWEERALAALTRTPQRSGRRMPGPASLQRQRPDNGIGSDEWWVDEGQPPMYRR
jgi:hypothetical protein